MKSFFTNILSFTPLSDKFSKTETLILGVAMWTSITSLAIELLALILL